MTDFTKKLLIIEPFYGGSHKALIDAITKNLDPQCFSLITLPAKKWHWRARCSALVLSSQIPSIESETVLLCSSVLNLTELVGLRGDLHKLRKIIYFHENQLIYPIQNIKQRDVQYAYNQILSSLTADTVVFNSDFNRTSFLDNINKILKLIPDHRPKGIKEKIESKSLVLYFPMDFPRHIASNRNNDCLHIVWPHRWEFDKGPDDFFQVLNRLKESNCHFKISVLGESFTDNPEVFGKIKDAYTNEIVHFGYMESKEAYYSVLQSSHVVVSTAKHEFFGVSMMEATYCGCYPLAPNNLVYPEMYPKDCLYSNLDQLFKKLHDFCLHPELAVSLRETLNVDFSKYSTSTLLPKFLEILDFK